MQCKEIHNDTNMYILKIITKTKTTQNHKLLSTHTPYDKIST